MPNKSSVIRSALLAVFGALVLATAAVAAHAAVMNGTAPAIQIDWQAVIDGAAQQVMF